jgi:HD-GYP domain-containing protein (c-di-GMP phosphodiesterase class II)
MARCRPKSRQKAGSRVTHEVNNVNCINSRAIIEYVRRHQPERLSELITGLPSPIGSLPRLDEYLCDENNWVPSSLVVKLFNNARLITNNPEVAFNIGFESITHRDLGYTQRLFVTLFSSPQRLLKQVNRLNTKLNNTKIIELIYNKARMAKLRWHWREGVQSSHDVCSYNRGIYSAIPTLWGYAPATVTEDPCTFEGGPYCEVSINWGVGVGKLRNLFERVFSRTQHLKDALDQVEKDKLELKLKFDEVAAKKADLDQKVEILKALNVATRTLGSSQDTQRALEQTLRPMINVLGFDRAMIMEYQEAEQRLEYLYGIGGEFDDVNRLKGYSIPLTKEDNLVVRVFQKRRPVMIRDARAAGLNPANRILRDFKPRQFVVCPMCAEDRIIGILGADRQDRIRQLTQNDAEDLQIFANSIAMVLERARIEQIGLQNLKQSYEGAVRALVKAIEVNDTYTKGHSERVARLSVKIAGCLGYDASRLDDLRFGCILHDVGKIGHASYLELQKNGPLTDEEYQRIKEHPVRGEEILKANEFFKENHRAIVRNHHERWDGKGYPDGLAGEDIPLEAQIVAVADAYDAMTTDRPYKGKRSPEQAAAEIFRCAGTHFSPKAAKAFMQFYQEQIITGKFEIGSEKD